jgi:hypothetical protein
VRLNRCISQDWQGLFDTIHFHPKEFSMRRLFPIVTALVLAIPACSSNSATTGNTKVTKEEKPLEPCHPGCFPAGTLVATPEGPRAIETIRLGEFVTLVGTDDSATTGKVNANFQTCNRLIEVQTESGSLLTTQTQPLCLSDGGFRAAGELTEGDMIWRWEKDKRRPARVLAIVPTGQEAPVYNLVVGESVVFVAGGFLARGKPPSVDTDATRGTE